MELWKYLQVRRQPEPIVPSTGELTIERLTHDPGTPITLRQINSLPENVGRRV
jgi:hypothetical protein